MLSVIWPFILMFSVKICKILMLSVLKKLTVFLKKRLATHLQALAAQVKNPEIVQLNTPLVKPTSICVACTDILLCADDEHQRINQLELSYNGVAAVDTSMREINYPDGVSSIESLCVWTRSAYLAASGKAGRLYAGL